MTNDPKTGWSDDQIVEHMRASAVEYSKWGFDPVQRNRIMDNELRPSYELLKGRGDDALRKLLPLMEDEHATIRWVAAAFAYDVDPAKCRRILKQVMTERGINGVMAWAALAERNLDIPAPRRSRSSLGTSC